MMGIVLRGAREIEEADKLRAVLEEIFSKRNSQESLVAIERFREDAAVHADALSNYRVTIEFTVRYAEP